jgi:outer membrane receptor protein involved in Fe transport
MKTAKILRPTYIRCASFLASTLLLYTLALAAELRGRVVDESGAVVAGARVELQSKAEDTTAVADQSGAFSLKTSAQSGTIRISAPGFASAALDWNGSTSPLTVTLKPASVSETVVVTGERNATRLEDTAANVSVLTQAELTSKAAITLDDALRQVPGFTIFRRSSSLTANPTTQGASIRGVGASGASRVLVLDDGIPLNDPFGGWVFWDRVPRLALDHAEVLRGGGSGLYGSTALGGVVSLVPQTSGSIINVEASGDSLNGHDVQGKLSRQLRGWTLYADGESFGNEGAFVVAERDRGLVDTPATLNFSNGTARVQHSLGSSGTAFLSGSLFAEERNNGTVQQVNSTHLGELRGGIDTDVGRNVFSFRVYGTGEHYHQSFSSISTDRNTESLVRWQTAPSDQAGFSAQWMRPISVLKLSLGVDGRFIHGETDETAFVANAPTTFTVAGGRDDLAGGFAEIAAAITKRLHASGGVRVDWWSNTEGFNRSTKLSTGATTVSSLVPHDEKAVSPRVGLVYDLASQWQLTASAYGGFRAPTLNELYRSFRLGNVLTLANEQLRAEHIQGGEAGLRYLRGRVMLSGTYFDENIDNPVGNITLTTTPALITRERQNMGALRARGVDADFVLVLPHVQLRSGYEYVHSIVTSFSAEPTLVGNIVPQVPAHVFTLSSIYNAPHRWTFVGLLRASSRQFDDDLNTFELAPYSVVGLSVSRQTGMLTWFASASNLLDTKVETAATPVFNYGSPRIITGGVRFTTAH